jgi:hypothetical protein
LITGLRGCTADVVILEEAAHMDKQVFFQVVVPLLGVKHTAVLAISTPDDEYNYYTQLLELGLFKTIKIGLTCESCQAMGLPCTHVIKKLPSWKTQSRQAMIQMVLASDPELCARETRGLVMSTKLFVLDRIWIKKFMEREPYALKENAQVLHMGIDPSGGGSGSDYAVCTLGIESGKFYIAGMDISDSHKHDVIVKMLQNHVLMLRAIPQYHKADIFLYIEANMSFISADEVCEMYIRNDEKFGPVIPVSDRKEGDGRYGVWSGQYEKEAYARGLAYTMSDGNLDYCRHMAGAKIEATKMVLQDQMKNLRREAKTPQDMAFQQVKYVYTGKSSGKRDDLCMALQIALHCMRKQRCNPKFLKWCHDKGYTRV